MYKYHIAKKKISVSVRSEQSFLTAIIRQIYRALSEKSSMILVIEGINYEIDFREEITKCGQRFKKTLTINLKGLNDAIKL